MREPTRHPLHAPKPECSRGPLIKPVAQAQLATALTSAPQHDVLGGHVWPELSWGVSQREDPEEGPEEDLETLPPQLAEKSGQEATRSFQGWNQASPWWETLFLVSHSRCYL